VEIKDTPSVEILDSKIHLQRKSSLTPPAKLAIRKHPTEGISD
jgi:hypothetical protein